MDFRLILFFAFLTACAHNGTRSTDSQTTSLSSNHKMVSNHMHQHGQAGCSHTKKDEGGVTYYEHNGEWHYSHSGHFDKK